MRCLLKNSIYEGLVSVDKKGNIISHLATSWRISKDGLSYTFILRKGVKFSNGEAFNADAVLINFEIYLQESKMPIILGVVWLVVFSL